MKDDLLQQDQPIPVHMQLRYWGIASAIFLLCLWYLGDVLLPFVLGGAIAYFLDPIADRLQRLGASRSLATGIIAVLLAFVTILMVGLVVPALIGQAASLIAMAPQLTANLQDGIASRFPVLLEDGGTARQAMLSLAEALKAKGGALLNSVVASAASLVSLVMLFVIVPVVAIYMLLDWDRMTSRVDSLLPREHAPVIRKLASDIDDTLAAFIRGMGTVCLVLGAYYAIALMLVGLQFGLVVGAVAGILTFIPYVGAIVGGALAIGLALFQFWGEWHWVAAVGIIFALGQFLEGNLLTPKLVGSSVGLHPVWLMLALSIFGSMFGFIGMLVAVPIAAAFGVLARFGVGKYTNSTLYRGHRTPVQE